MKTFKQFFNESTKEQPVMTLTSNGNIEEWRLPSNNWLHREDGPAVIWLDGTCKIWYKNNMIHREDGPAMQLNKYYFGRKEKDFWYLNDNEVTKEEVMRRYPQYFRKSQIMDKLI